MPNSVSFDTIEDRRKFANFLIQYISEKYNLDDTQIFIFGSFLKDSFVNGKSDIDIGVFSESEEKMYNIKYDLENLIDRYIKNDIVVMNLSDKLLINIPILLYGEELTPYRSDLLVDYAGRMINKYGYLEKGLDSRFYE